MLFKVLVVCDDGKRGSVIEKIKVFKDIKNIQQRKDENELLLEVESNDEAYVKNNVIKRMQDIEEVSNASLIS